MSLKKAALIIFLVLLVDQIVKIYIKTNFVYGSNGMIDVTGWFKLLLIENEGAAWGTRLSDIFPISNSSGKLILTIFRLFAIGGIGYWLYTTVQKKNPKILVVSISLIFAGALGNIIDSVFYGVIFSESTYNQVATIFADKTYGNLFHGKVVDMLYFPMIDTIWPDWMPILGGQKFRFFEPVFNIADTAISTGVGILLVFNKKAFPKKED
ncbi:lipoprotein signal peptidase [Ascidiimonas sp. W6]|uniref:lipoprotein signal peptidase n=1 Tax=Ascidiimonas meishanensis TaxID=3128903 RepID=UPI0030EE12D5